MASLLSMQLNILLEIYVVLKNRSKISGKKAPVQDLEINPRNILISFQAADCRGLDFWETEDALAKNILIILYTNIISWNILNPKIFRQENCF